jgi:hypothetical protein
MSTLIAILLVNQLAPIVWYLCKWGVTLWQIYSVINLLKLLNKLHTNNILFSDIILFYYSFHQLFLSGSKLDQNNWDTWFHHHKKYSRLSYYYKTQEYISDNCFLFWTLKAQSV